MITDHFEKKKKNGYRACSVSCWCFVTVDLVLHQQNGGWCRATLGGNSGYALIRYNGIVFAAECVAERMQWKSGVTLIQARIIEKRQDFLSLLHGIPPGFHEGVMMPTSSYH